MGTSKGVYMTWRRNEWTWWSLMTWKSKAGGFKRGERGNGLEGAMKIIHTVQPCKGRPYMVCGYRPWEEFLFCFVFTRSDRLYLLGEVPWAQKPSRWVIQSSVHLWASTRCPEKPCKSCNHSHVTSWKMVWAAIILVVVTWFHSWEIGPSET